MKVKSKLKLFLTYFIITIALFAIIISGLFLSFYYIQTNNYLNILKTNEQHTIFLQKKSILNKFNSIYSDLLFLSKQDGITKYIHSNKSELKKIVDYEYLEFCKFKKKYDQIRFINDKGMECSRVNYNNGNPFILSSELLQNKKNRYYFYDSLKLNEGQMFVSPMDLNIEKGIIENPIKPMIRFATPVVDNNNDKKGIVILNYFADILINSITEIAKLSKGKVMLLNPQSYYLVSPNANEEWAFMYKHKKNLTFKNNYPHIWSEILKNSNYQIHSDKGLFTSVKIYPLPDNISSSSGANQTFKKSSVSLKGNEYFWILVSFVPNKDLYFSSQHLKDNLFLLWIISVILSCFPSTLIAAFLVKRKTYKKELFHTANFDNLTDLPNRNLFMNRLLNSVNQSDRYNTKFALLFIDLDGFKSVNDNYGHAVGDKVLQIVAKRLLELIRKSDTVARLGGDEFVSILYNIDKKKEIIRITKKINKSLSSPYIIDDIECNVSASIGITLYSPKCSNAEKILNIADNAMYTAKKNGKNTFSFGE